MAKVKVVFETDYFGGAPVLPSQEVLGFEILGYSVFKQHVNENDSKVKLLISLPGEAEKHVLSTYLKFIEDIPQDEQEL